VTLPAPPLLVITDRRQARRPLEEVAEALFAGGCRWLSLREKDLDGAARLALLRRLVALGRRYGAAVTVHGDVEAALSAGADGVHLPGGVLPAEARRRLGARALIGCSVHRRDELMTVAAGGADYATLSPIFASASKPGYGPPVGLDQLAAAAAATALPVIALGGIDETNAGSCLEAGAAGLAVMGPAMTAPDPAGMFARLIRVVAGRLPAAPREAIVALPGASRRITQGGDET
jgi:thiamine-phosphate pyrophosphorylase